MSFGSPEHGFIPICNGKSIVNGGKKGLLRSNEVKANEVVRKTLFVPPSTICTRKLELTKTEIKQASLATNKLAREKFKEKMLQEILFDMSVCKIEGWPIDEYSLQLKSLIDLVAKRFKKKNGALETAEGRGTACNSASMQVALDI